MIGEHKIPFTTAVKAADSSKVCIEVTNLTRIFSSRRPNTQPIEANKGLSFQVRQGEIFGLLGPNGAGKTTLIHQLLGLLRPTSGSILINGIDVVAKPEEAKRLMGFLPQTNLSMRGVKVSDALYYTGRLRGQSHFDTQRQVAFLLAELGMEEYALRPVHRLSGGMQRMVTFGAALMGWPPVLLLDEPTNELDPRNRRLVWDFIRRVNHENGMSCVLVTHNVLEAERVIGRVAIMQDGQFIQIGTPGEIKARLDGKARLEFTLKEGLRLSELEISQLVTLGNLEELRPNQFRLRLSTTQINLTDVVLNILGLDRLDDFRLAPPSLEDVYLEIGQIERQEATTSHIQPSFSDLHSEVRNA